MALGVLIIIYAALAGLIIGIALGLLKLILWASFGIFIGALWVVEKLVKLLFRPFFSQRN